MLLETYPISFMNMSISSVVAEDTCSSLVDNALTSIDQIGFLPLSFLVLCCWFVLNKCHDSIVKVLLLRLSIRDSEVKRLQTVYWNISFTAVTIPFALQALSISIEEVPDIFYFNIDKHVTAWFSQDTVSTKVKIIYILLTGFFLNKICQISIEKGCKNVEFVVSELFAVFFVSTFAYRCIRFGMAFMVVYNAVQSLLEFSRMLFCFCKMYPSQLAYIITRVVFVLHIALWIIVFLDIVPSYFLMTTLNSVTNSFYDASHVLILMLLNTALWAFYLLHILYSPLTIFIKNVILNKPYSLEILLFNLSTPQIIAELSQTSSPTNCGTKEKQITEKHNKQKSKENLRKVYQTVKCFIRIKRKLKRIRTKLKEAAESQEGSFLESQDVLCDIQPRYEGDIN